LNRATLAEYQPVASPSYTAHSCVIELPDSILAKTFGHLARNQKAAYLCVLATDCEDERIVIAAWEGSLERRELARFVVRCPTIFEWTDNSGRTHAGAGFTRDISGGGVFVQSAAWPPDGTRFRIEVMLPAGQAAERGLKLSSSALVVRVVETGEARGFAAVSKFAFVSELESLPSPRTMERHIGAKGAHIASR
jgi:hypothetical protein